MFFIVVGLATIFVLISSVLVVCVFRRVKSRTADNSKPLNDPASTEESGSNYVYVVPKKPEHKETAELPALRNKTEGSTLNYVQVDLKPRSPSKPVLDEDRKYCNAKEFLAVRS